MINGENGPFKCGLKKKNHLVEHIGNKFIALLLQFLTREVADTIYSFIPTTMQCHSIVTYAFFFTVALNYILSLSGCSSLLLVVDQA